MTIIACLATCLVIAADPSPPTAPDAHATPEHPPSGITVKTLRSDPLHNPTGDPLTATLQLVTIPPLASSPPHRHPGTITGYVLEGTFEFQVDDGPIQTLKAGDTFFEPRMALHSTTRNPDRKTTTRLLVTMVHPTTAKKLALPAEEK